MFTANLETQKENTTSNWISFTYSGNEATNVAYIFKENRQKHQNWANTKRQNKQYNRQEHRKPQQIRKERSIQTNV